MEWYETLGIVVGSLWGYILIAGAVYHRIDTGNPSDDALAAAAWPLVLPFHVGKALSSGFSKMRIPKARALRD